MSDSRIYKSGTVGDAQDEPDQEAPLALEKKLRKDLQQRTVDSAAQVCLKRGDFRNTTSLVDSERQIIEQIMEQIEPIPKGCFRNSQLAVLDSNVDSVSYVEGYTLSREVPIPIHHAWIEVNEKVAEITIPRASLSPGDAVYFGVEYDLEMLQHIRDEGRLGHPVAGNLNQRDMIGEFREGV